MTIHDFRISLKIRTELSNFSPLFAYTNDLDAISREAGEFSFAFNRQEKKNGSTRYISPANLNAAAVLHLLYQSIITRYLATVESDYFSRFIPVIRKNPGCQKALAFFAKEFPSPALVDSHPDIELFTEESLRGLFIHKVMTVNPAMVKAIEPLISPKEIAFPDSTKALYALIGGYTKDYREESRKFFNGEDGDLFNFLTIPAKKHPDSLLEQIGYIMNNWADLIPEEIKPILYRAMTGIREEYKPPHSGTIRPESYVPDYKNKALNPEYEAFTDDRSWMPDVVMIAKSTLVWLSQLSRQYGEPIVHLDQIPDHELDLMAERGINALWLIGLWERSSASKKIKVKCGNPDAEASAYSLKNYEISAELGGWSALQVLREKCVKRGIRLASDMVPNHTGIDSDWVMNHPEYFISQNHPPFPAYTFNGPDLSDNPDIEIKIEDHYYNRTDAAVTFMRRDKRTGEVSYIFHGNDGTSMPWNDTAQLDFLNPLTREAVFQQIRHVAKNFSIIRFDAAMTLAKKHIRRLWYPAPGEGGDIAGRGPASLTDEQFESRIPKEFWREVVDRMEAELPDTLLLAEAFWMLEGYFVRTLGMHRVYNSAFMNMLKNQENAKYRKAISETLEFEPEILKRYVNFMNNPDEDTAIAQFGDGDRYFGCCTLLATLPGLPLIGHGQIEGYREKYGMEYKKAYWDESPNGWLIGEHYRRIFPLLKKRYLFSGVNNFQLFDMRGENGIEESVFCYSNGNRNERSLVLYNNRYERAEGWIKESCPKLCKAENTKKVCTLAQALNLHNEDNLFTIYSTFPDRLTYITPSKKVFEHGSHFALNGYQTIVIVDISEKEDKDGKLAELCESLQGRGVKSIKEELAYLRMKPVHEAFEPLRSKESLALIDSLISGKNEKKKTRALALSLYRVYQDVSESLEKITEFTRSQLPENPVFPDVKQTLALLTGIAESFKKDITLERGAAIMEESGSSVLSALMLYPFIDADMSISDAVEVLKTMLVPRFLSPVVEDEETGERAGILGAVILQSGRIAAGEKKSLVFFEKILEDPEIALYAGCNKWQGTSWYRKERMQELIWATALSGRWYRRGFRNYLRVLMKAEREAGCKLDALFS